MRINNIYAYWYTSTCSIGTAADTEMTTALISSKLELHALITGRVPRVATAMTMLKQLLFKHQGQIGAALVLGLLCCHFFNNLSSSHES